MDTVTGLLTTPTLTICCYLHPPSVTVPHHTCAHTHTNTHTHTESKERENQELCWTGSHLLGDTLPSGPGSFHLCASLSYLPVLVRTMKALAQHLKDDSTAPTATASEGSLVRWECLLSSSNSCLWKVAASASRAIWAQRDHGVRVGGLLSIAHTSAAALRVIHTTGSDGQMRS